MSVKSILWEPSREEFQKIVKNYNSIAEILRHFGLHTGAGNYKTIKKRFKKDLIDVSHINFGINSNFGRSSTKRKSAIEYMVPKS